MRRAFYNKIVRPIFTINDTPHAIALGVSLGVFIGFTPTVGYQMILVLLIGTLIRANRIVAVLLTWISNPITAIPLYYAYYWLGCKVMDVEIWTFSTFAPKVQGIWGGDPEASFWVRVLTVFSKLATEIGAPLFLGSFIIALVLAVPLYPWIRWLLKRHRKMNGTSADVRSSEEGRLPSSRGEGIKNRETELIDSETGESAQDSQRLKTH